MDIPANPQDVQGQCLAWREQGLRICLVPTMGYYHAGHVSLFDWARSHADKVVVSLFVNPAQFGPNEDLEAYPRDMEGDSRLCREHGVDLLFTPDPATMYEDDHATWVAVENLTQGLCGRTRPVHFRGVATVVTKLFMLTLPHAAVFGQKDWQQLAVIRRMARDLNMPIEIIGRPTVREADGLAMSSRNVYLSPEERGQAPQLYKGLQHGADLIRQGQKDSTAVTRTIKEYYAEHLALGRLDYLEMVHPDSLEPLETLDGPCLIAVAMLLGKARLIDNLLVEA
ncbi:MAG: pantoate--beta-alanine ligase [Desulfovibrio sp.]|nr:MAG: pantoate--beta-alanine ligase [Desulfovibrio sp.]